MIPLTNITNIKLTEQQKRLLILVPAGIIFVWMGWSLTVGPALGKIKNIRAAISTSSERLALIAEIQNLENRRNEAETFLATEEARHEILGKLTSLAKQSGFVLQSLTPNVEKAEPYARLAFDLKAEASFPSLIGFLGRVQELKPGVAVSELTMSRTYGGRRSDRSTSSLPKIELALETYLK